jgi:hypothetical protein
MTRTGRGAGWLGLVAAAGVLIVGCSNGGDEPAEADRPADETDQRVEQFLDVLSSSLPVPAPDRAGVPATSPAGGFDCSALAETFAPVATDPAALLVAAAATESSDRQELISAAQINIADGLAACGRGDLDAAAGFFASAAAARDLLEEAG